MYTQISNTSISSGLLADLTLIGLDPEEKENLEEIHKIENPHGILEGLTDLDQEASEESDESEDEDDLDLDDDEDFDLDSDDELDEDDEESSDVDSTGTPE